MNATTAAIHVNEAGKFLGLDGLHESVDAGVSALKRHADLRGYRFTELAPLERPFVEFTGARVVRLESRVGSDPLYFIVARLTS